MPSQKIEKGIVALCFGIIFGIIIFYGAALEIAGMFSDNPSRAVWGLSGALFACGFGYLIKIIIGTNDAQTQLFQIKIERTLSDGVSGIKADILDVKEDVAEISCAATKHDGRLEKIENTLSEMNHYRDEKKRRWEEYNSDWVAVRKNFEKLKNNDLYAMGRIFKDSVQGFAHEVTLSDLCANTKTITDFMTERGRAYTEDFYHRAKQMLPPDFVDFFRAENASNRDTYRSAIKDLLENDKVNNRAEKIHLLTRQFMGMSHNTLYGSWKQWAAAHQQDLATDPVQRYFKNSATV